MPFIPELNTRHGTLKLEELSIGDALNIAAIPSGKNELSTTEFLKSALSDFEGDHANPSSWSVQTRILALCHYLSAMSDEADFQVGENGRLSDYLAPEMTTEKDRVDMGEWGGDHWFVGHLNGQAAETIERLEGELQNIHGAAHWIIGAMAAQLFRDNDAPPPDNAEQYEHFLLEKMRVFLHFKESDFIDLRERFLKSAAELNHYFKIAFSHDGIVVLPKAAAGGPLAPAQFQVLAAFSEWTKAIAERIE